MTDPVAWAVTIGPPDDVSVYEAYAAHQKEEAVAMADDCRFGDKDKPLPLAPLYFLPALTEEERAALTLAWMNLSETARRGLQKGHSEEQCEPLRAASLTIRKLLGRLT